VILVQRQSPTYRTGALPVRVVRLASCCYCYAGPGISALVFAVISYGAAVRDGPRSAGAASLRLSNIRLLGFYFDVEPVELEFQVGICVDWS